MSLYGTTVHSVTPSQQLSVTADERGPYFPLRTDSLSNTWNSHGPPAPPPSPKCVSQDAFEQVDMHHLHQQIEAYKCTPLRRVFSADDVSSKDENEREGFDGDDDATIVAASNAPSSRCSDATLLGETVSNRRRFRLLSRTRKQQRPSTSAGGTSQSPSWGRQISSPLFSSSTVNPNIVASSSKPSRKTAKSYPERGHFRPTRPSPQIPVGEVKSRWSESDDGKGEKKIDLSKPVPLATFPGRGKRFRRRLSDLFCAP